VSRGGPAALGNKGGGNKPIIVCLAALLAAAVFASLLAGRFALSPAAAAQVVVAKLSGHIPEALRQSERVFFIIRLPRILLTLLVGASLAISGAAYQSLFRNPLVSPDILGVTQGAGVGAALGILLSLPAAGVQALAFGCGLATMAAVLAIAKIAGTGRNATVVLILTGTVMNALFASIVSFTKYVADANDKLPEITFWLMGSFARSGNHRNVLILFFIFAAAGTALFLLRWKINILSFPEEEARSLGVNTRALRTVVILASTLLTAASVSFCGTIHWVGLIIPHISRLLAGPDNARLLPVAVLLGALFMLVVDDFARAIIPGELPVGVLTAFIGAPLFLYMLFAGRREWL